MRKQQGGHIISVSSVSAIVAPPGLGFYSATKKALESLHEGEAEYLMAQFGIKMTLFQCGNIITNTVPMVDRLEFGSRTVDEETTAKYLHSLHTIQQHYKQYYTTGVPVKQLVEKLCGLVFSPDVASLDFCVTLGID